MAGPAVLVEGAGQLLELGLVAAGLDHGVAEVGPVEAGDEQLGVAEVELVGDVAADRVGGRGRQRDAGGRAELPPGQAEPGVVGAEVVPPLADAVGLVDGQQAGLGSGPSSPGSEGCGTARGRRRRGGTGRPRPRPSAPAARPGRACC